MSLTSIAFLMAYMSGLGLCVLRGPIWGLYTYVAVFYLHPPSRWWGAYLPDLRWSLLAAAVTLAAVLIRKRDPVRDPFFSHGLTWTLFLYVAWMWIQTPFVPSEEHLAGTVLFTKYLLLLYLIYRIVDSHERVRDFLVAHVAGCFYLGWLAYVAVGGGRLEGVGGPGIDDSNTMSMQFGTGVIVGAMLLMTEKGWRFWLILAAMPFMLNGMMQGGSRGAFLGLLMGGFCLFWLKPPAYRRQFLLFGALGAVLFAYLANDVFLARIGTLRAVTSEEEEVDFSASSRLTIMEAQWRMFSDRPFGAGHGGTATLSPQYLAPEYLTRATPDGPAARSSHNTFMSVVVDQGIPGVILLAALLAWVWKKAGAITKRSGLEMRAWGYGSAISAALAVAAAAGQFAPYLKAEVQIWLLGLLLTSASFVGRRAREETLERSRGVSDKRGGAPAPALEPHGRAIAAPRPRVAGADAASAATGDAGSP